MFISGHSIPDFISSKSSHLETPIYSTNKKEWSSSTNGIVHGEP